MNKPSIYFRADGSSTIGLGHVIRSLALAEMLNKDFHCTFIIQQPQPGLIQQIQQVCKEIIELPVSSSYQQEAQHLAESRLSKGDIIVLDGYGFDTQCQGIFKERGCKVVCIDDLHAQHFLADAVINHAPGLDGSQYKTEAYTQLCLGLSYSLLRPEFLKMASQARSISNLDTLFVCFGGADPFNLTHTTLNILQNSPRNFKAIHVVVGSANPHKNSLKLTHWDKKLGDLSLHENLSAGEMSELMNKCKVAIVPASSLLLEVIAVKMPVITGYFVDNQKDVYKGFLKAGLVKGAEDLQEVHSFEPFFQQIEVLGPESIVEKQAQAGIGNSLENIQRMFKTLNRGAFIHS